MGAMIPLLLAAVLSLVFFTAVLAVEVRDGERHHVRELLLIVGLLMAVASYATHAIVVESWPALAGAYDLGERRG